VSIWICCCFTISLNSCIALTAYFKNCIIIQRPDGLFTVISNISTYYIMFLTHQYSERAINPHW
ncbi:MAG: hypothetical protein ACKPKO_00465, partial [Candidatus Fonsibacter sp.]